ncbi:phosphoenolpyruvate carboxylase [Neptunicella marina]|uniref:Phosphoenolpyruvate carboxylase n=1 Tax=Neptunicella marina TaxID=2125989 RepID=A0A8J6IS22_9ALTE|nr:phosphoenolpyruvate carboxylase [Neptunicella marina]MBC3765736.1 phosphoenolpyruvate carboxylase [Neptunicella marina]
MSEQTHLLQDTVRDLGRVLGQTIQAQLGEGWLERIEQVRKKGRKAFEGDSQCADELQTLFSELNDDDLLTLGRAFCQFLNLANIAEQEYNSSKDDVHPITQLFNKLDSIEHTDADLANALDELEIELVLTAHPTEVSRRTLIHKYTELAQCLDQLHNTRLNDDEREVIEYRIADLVAQAWHTDEIRSERPTPVDEASWGFSVIENSLWQAVPEFIRELDRKLNKKYGMNIPIDAAPVRISSWMGGDRDGNPFVTASVTQRVLLLARRRAATLFFNDVDRLQSELSMAECNSELRAEAGDALEPYRTVLRDLREKLRNTYKGINAVLNGEEADRKEWISCQQELLHPLMLCYQSLHECGMGVIADGELLDCIRRVHCFGAHLLRLDIRQDSERHADAIAELTDYLGLGDYNSWSEKEKQTFLQQELASKRPLIPQDWQPSAPVKEVLDTCKVIASNNAEGFGIYIISMASLPSDVYSVQLLLKAMGVNWSMPVAPLFETLDDLNNAADVMNQLFSNQEYLQHTNQRQYVMIGYSDSAKDAGALAAGWAQYQSQEALVALADQFDVELTLFHGRGGTIGRGGLPAQAAILSQPPGSLKGGFRVTEQGETIRYKFGMPEIAKKSLCLYAGAILQAIIDPPPAPKAEWRELMTSMAASGRDNYRAVVRDDPEFVRYFRVATPELELGKLPLGSRPAKRKPNGGVESLRAIPWIFAWAQTRLVLPSWLGVMKAIQTALDNGKQPLIEEMIQAWPFFHSRLSMLDMVFLKADVNISGEYDKRLVPEELRYFGQQLRDELQLSIDLINKLFNQQSVMQHDPAGKDSMQLRAGYLQPLHYLQIELLDRVRKQPEEQINHTLERAMMITIAGIAVGMRNTG